MIDVPSVVVDTEPLVSVTPPLAASVVRMCSLDRSSVETLTVSLKVSHSAPPEAMYAALDRAGGVASMVTDRGEDAGESVPATRCLAVTDQSASTSVGRVTIAEVAEPTACVLLTACWL